MLKEIHAEGNTIVLITHDSDVAQQAQRVVRIADGQITSDGAATKDVKCE